MFAIMNQIEAMDTYFVVIELPGGSELKFTESKYSPDNFWVTAASALQMGEVHIVSRREDTGVSEELRKHITTLSKFTTFILAQITLCKNELLCNTTIFTKTADWIVLSDKEVVIDEDANFQLVTLDIA
jgi:hypothetical protein